MEFELAYELAIEVDKEVVFVRRDDRHRKVRVLITEKDAESGSTVFTGHSLGSSVREIKAAKKDETPVPVKGRFKEIDGKLTGTVEAVK